MDCRLLLLGPPTLLRNSETVTLKSQKGQALLWYLASQPAVIFSRDHLCGLLWDDAPADAARRNFNTMLSRLRAELPMDVFRGARGQLGWNGTSRVATDVAEFSRLFDGSGVLPKAGEAPPSEAAIRKNALHRAVALRRGPFLEGFSCASAPYEQWMLAARQRWDARALDATTALIEAEKADGRWSVVVSLARAALHIDPLREAFHRTIMEALMYEGNRSAALAQFELCRRILQDELGTEPDGATAALFETIKSSRTPFFDVASGSSGKLPPAAKRIVPEPFRGLTAAMPPLVGRQSPYREIVGELARAARRRENRLVLLRGEAGIGKTRLLSEIVRDAIENKWDDVQFSTVLAGRAYESMLDAPYASFVDAVAPAVSAVDWQNAALPDVWLRELSRLLPGVLAQRKDVHPPLPSDSGDERIRLFQAVSKFLSVLPQPVLLALDDLQWADPFTASLIAYLLRLPPDEPNVSVLAAVRTGDESESLRVLLSDLKRGHCLTDVPLTHLTEDDTLALVTALFPDSGRERAARVYSQTRGHPLYTVELANMLAGADGAPDDDPSPLPIPPTVQDVFFGRLARLGQDALDAAETLAVFRRGATMDTLQRAASKQEARVVEAVDALIRSHIADEDHRGTLSFRHDVFRRVVLERMTPTRRTHLHRRAYAAITAASPETSTGGGSDPSIARWMPDADGTVADLVDHAVAGRLWEQALLRTQQAAAAAEKVHAFASAVNYLNTAIVCLDNLPATDGRRRQRLDIVLHVAKLDSTSAPDVRDDRLADATRLARQFGEKSYLARIRMAQAESLILQGRCIEAEALLQSLARLDPKDPRMALGLSAWQGAIAALVGDVPAALSHFHRVQEMMGEQVLKPGTSIYAGLASCYAAAGQFARAEAALAVMEREEQEQGYESLTSKFLTVAATVAYFRGRWEDAGRFAAQGLHTSRTAEDWPNEALSALWLGAALLESGADNVLDGHPPARRILLPAASVQRSRDHPPSDSPEQQALEALKGALAASRRAQTYTRREFMYAFLGLAHARAGRWARADEAIQKGFSLARRFGYKEGAALCTEMQGRIQKMRGQRRAAAEGFRRALTRYERLGHVVGVDRCRRRLQTLT